ARIIDEWYERAKENYVTDADSELLGIEPELKRFHERSNHRIKFARKDELDVTYGLHAQEKNGQLLLESSVNNKSERFDYEGFVKRLEAHYWESRFEKPWTDPDFDHFAYGDLLECEPRMGRSVSLDLREEKADIIRLSFSVNRKYEELLLGRTDVLQDLVENYCLAPLRRIYAESYHGQ
ncbi:MAG: hypothetical protein HY645_11780, partial [Acidobacteria bacterium]|nr:hypothetical protein [Acidobacteriota bacterium]